MERAPHNPFWRAFMMGLGIWLMLTESPMDRLMAEAAQATKH